MITRDYVRGFVDGEGGFNYAAIQMYNTEYELMRNIGDFLTLDGYRVHGLETPWKGTNKPCYRIAITGARDLAKYSLEIGFEIKSKQDALENYLRKLCQKKKGCNLEEYYVYLRGLEAGDGITKIAKDMGVLLSTAQYRRDRKYPLDDDFIRYLTPYQPVIA